MPAKKKLRPKQEEAREKKEALALAMERKEERLFLNLLTLYPNWAALHRELGVYYGDVNNFQEARHHLQRANCLNRESPSALLALSVVFQKIGDESTARLLVLKAEQVRERHRRKNYTWRKKRVKRQNGK